MPQMCQNNMQSQHKVCYNKPTELDFIVMEAITGPRYCHSVSWSVKREMKVKDTDHHVI